MLATLITKINMAETVLSLEDYCESGLRYVQSAVMATYRQAAMDVILGVPPDEGEDEETWSLWTADDVLTGIGATSRSEDLGISKNKSLKICINQHEELLHSLASPFSMPNTPEACGSPCLPSSSSSGNTRLSADCNLPYISAARDAVSSLPVHKPSSSEASKPPLTHEFPTDKCADLDSSSSGYAAGRDITNTWSTVTRRASSW